MRAQAMAGISNQESAIGKQEIGVAA